MFFALQTKNGHESITHVFVDASFVLNDRFTAGQEIAIENVDDVMGDVVRRTM